jgi:hypothetical protein
MRPQTLWPWQGRLWQGLQEAQCTWAAKSYCQLKWDSFASACRKSLSSHDSHNKKTVALPPGRFCGSKSCAQSMQVALCRRRWLSHSPSQHSRPHSRPKMDTKRFTARRLQQHSTAYRTLKGLVEAFELSSASCAAVPHAHCIHAEPNVCSCPFAAIHISVVHEDTKP